MILRLPWGSNYRAATNPAALWSEEKYQMANVMDYLAVINWRLMGCPAQYKPELIERPGDKQRREQAVKQAKSVIQKIENTQWEEA